MALHDFHDKADWLAFVGKIREKARKADRRKGEKPQDHPSASFLVENFMSQLNEAPGAAPQGRMSLDTTLTVPHYLPCIRPDYELRPLMISSMALETHHRGSQTLLRVLTPPAWLSMVLAIVEDEEGTGALLQLYNQPEKTKVGDNILQVGDVCIIKEPFFTQFVPDRNHYVLRVDHVSDIIWLQDSDPRIPSKWRKKAESLSETSQDIRLQGNAAVQKGNWAEAERLYTKAILAAKSPEEKQLAYLNRSLTNLRLDRPDKALDDASKGNPDEGPPREKAVFREAQALYSLRKFDSCLEKLVVLVRSNPKNSDAWAEIRRVQQRLREEKTGSYKFNDMYKQAEATPPLIDCATYIGSVGVRDSPGRGKGLFTTKPVKAGELLLCEKAFGYIYASDDSPIGISNTKLMVDEDCDTFYIGGQADLYPQVIQKLYHNHAGSEKFRSLDHGNYNPVNISEVDGAPVVDTFFVSKICKVNGFGAPRTTQAGLATSVRGVLKEDVSAADNSCGVWLLASRINHSCIPNCVRSFIGDMQVIRACVDMEAGTEIHFQYRSPEPNENFEETQKLLLRQWGFTCDCALCRNKKSTPPEIFQKRKQLYGTLMNIPMLTVSASDLAPILLAIDILERTFTVEQDAPPLPHMELWSPYFWLGEALVNKRMSPDGMNILLKALKTVGFIIEANFPGAVDEKTGKKASLEIKRWGVTDHRMVEAFLLMLPACSTLAPELSEAIKGYATLAYRIAYGEDETFSKRYPNFTYEGSTSRREY
ncbi:hypothetical protein GGS26DRAFT_598610 [Hypomontagnella submonticulosa]|nr:hypothetical protein GGS26DRAFT_598610 [Hypomontagnella submonticulosa]